ncbi:MAG: type II toxin-antitoxin system HicA family toxin [Smithella sp.]
MKYGKLLEKAKSSPGNLRFGELKELALKSGLPLRSGKGSHMVTLIDGQPYPIQEDGNGKCKEYQVKRIVKAIEDLEDGKQP